MGQKLLKFGNGWGGKRKGAGMKRKGKRRQTPHAKRVELKGEVPLHVTVRVKEGVPSLRRREAHEVLRRVLAGCKERGSFRVVHYTVLFNHFHFVVEARTREDVSRGMGALKTSLARQLNKLWGREGKVFDGRYHDRVVGSPTQMRRVLEYVFGNARKHGEWYRPGRPDPYSSGYFFTGWEDFRGCPAVPGWLAAARTWLLRSGWSRAGPLRLGCT